MILLKTSQFKTVCKGRQWLHHTNKTAQITKGDITCQNTDYVAMCCKAKKR